MPNASMSQVLRDHGADLGLVLGNGINRFGNASTTNPWDALLMAIARDCAPEVRAVPPGTTLTEFYDVLDLRSTARVGELQEQFCAQMQEWEAFAHHRTIMA